MSRSRRETGSLNPWHEGQVRCDPRFTCIPWDVTTTDKHSGLYSAVATGNQELRQDFATPFAPGSIGSFTYWSRIPGGQIPFVFEFIYPTLPGNSNENSVFGFVPTTGTGWEQVDVTPFLDPTQPLIAFSVWFLLLEGPAPSLAPASG